MEPTEDTTTAVPVVNTSSACIASSMLTGSSDTWYPMSLNSATTLRRVTPGKIVPFKGGVFTVLPLTTNILQLDT